MDPLGVLAAIVALALYPGGAFLALVVALAGRIPRTSGRLGMPSARGLIALATIDLAVASAPLPASPVSSLPPNTGAAPDIVVVAVLVAASLVLVAPGRWDARRILSAAGATTAAALAVVAAASLALTTITGEPGARMAAVRAIATLAILAVAAQVCGSPANAPLERRVVLAGTAVLGLSLVVPAGLSGWAALAGAVATGAATVGYLALITAADRVLARASTVLSALCGALGAAAIVVVLVAGRA